MRPDIHPEYNTITVKCTCGNEFEVGSSLQDDKLQLEVCNKCHPFYTGKQKMIDTTGAVERFRERFGSIGAAARKKED